MVDPAHVAAPDGDAAGERPLLGAGTGFAPLAQSLLVCEPGGAVRRGTGEGEEVLFVLAGAGALHLGGDSHALEPESGAYLAPGESYDLVAEGPEPLRLLAVAIPDPERGGPGSERAVVRRLADQERGSATTQREFRIVADPASGLRSATHFVGYIPPVRAPEHFHTYDEVIYVLDGEGVMHFEGAEHRLRAGSSIQLPARTVHCLENTGNAVMRIVAVFRPAGSPAAAYYPDGTPAYTPHEEEQR
ncbi:MAG TPA: cupin domain-containing protein [Solirubrobacteraceae bacterium]|jgi:quercetin dioxygenase-like cupin family protein|nr:cupin domain-containing protein [Solirubrobacteraceae bacterium]